jgi:4-hydroxysphinganine ceramide fatty acyl 2-hydroxylase
MEYKAIHDIKPKNDKAAKMFKNPVLDKLTSSHASIPISMLVLFAIAFLYWGTQRTEITVNSYVSLVATGILAWTLFEYFMHRYFYHMLPTNKIKRLDSVQYARIAS